MEPKHGHISPAPPVVDLELSPRPDDLITQSQWKSLGIIIGRNTNVGQC